MKLEYVSGCHVLRLHASSDALIDSRLDHVDPVVEVVGLLIILLDGENEPWLLPRSGGPKDWVP